MTENRSTRNSTVDYFEFLHRDRTIPFNRNHALGKIAFDDAMQAVEQPVFVATLIVEADSVGLI